MKLTLVAASISIVSLWSVASAAAERVALLIGNSTYLHESKLNNPLNDVAEMARVLDGLGFDVVSVLNASEREMGRALKQFGHRAREADVAVFFYSGHGMEISGKNFLIPVDAQLERAEDAPFEAIDLDLAIDVTGGASRLSVVIVDACRNNTFPSASKGAKGLRAVRAQSGHVIAFATEPGTIALDGSAHLSPYTQALSERIESRPGEDVVRLFTAPEFFERVQQLSGGRQRPYVEIGTPLLHPARLSEAPDQSAWAEVDTSNDPDLLEAFAVRYPESTYALVARERARSLRSLAELEARRAEITKLEQSRKEAERVATLERENAEERVREVETVKRELEQERRAAQERAEAANDRAERAETERDALEETNRKLEGLTRKAEIAEELAVAAEEDASEAEASASAAAAKEQASIAAAKRQEEARDWEGLSQSRDPTALGAFLRKHPAGAFSEEATARLEVLHTEAMEAQKKLNALGYDVGEADGFWGPNSQLGMKKFQAQAGLPVDGRLAVASLEALRDEPVPSAPKAPAAPAAKANSKPVAPEQDSKRLTVDDVCGPPGFWGRNILHVEPPFGTLPHKKVRYVDDGSCRNGYLKKITGGNNSRGIPRKYDCVPIEEAC